MDTEFRYKLDSPRITGRRQQKTTCPQCGRSRCFVRYVDTHNNCSYLSEEVGRCDHEQSCGYHYTPADYYNDHPWVKDKAPIVIRRRYTPPPPRPLQPLDMQLVINGHSAQSNFWQWFSGKCAEQLDISPETLQSIYEDYRIGATDKGEVIFWQIDEHERVRTGHIMQYDSNGHRCGYQDWTHSRMIRQGQLPKDFNLCQCFYGQHLLSKRPDAQVCIVESEKTALIMAAQQSDFIWLATCGSSGLNTDKLECLRGRRFTLFPDSGCFGKWQATMQKTQGLQYTITNQMEQYPINTDIADILLEPP